MYPCVVGGEGHSSGSSLGIYLYNDHLSRAWSHYHILYIYIYWYFGHSSGPSQYSSLSGHGGEDKLTDILFV